MNVHITGANGYLGGWLVSTLLESGYNVTGEDSHGRPTHGNADPYKSLREADAVIHTAWYTSAGNGQPELQRHCLDRTMLLANQAEHCKKLRRFIFTSTASVYGERTEEMFESSPCEPNCCYSKAKHEAEQHIKDVLGDKATIIRLSSLMGKGITRTKREVAVNAMAIDGYRNKKIEVWNPEASKPILHVRDAATLITKVIADEHTYNYINMAAFSYTAYYIASTVSALTGASVQIVGDRSGPRSCLLNCDRLNLMFPKYLYRNLEDTIREFRDYVPTDKDKNIPWTVTPKANEETTR